MMYKLTFSKNALKDISLLRKSAPQVFDKLQLLLLELMKNPRSGTGKVELLKYGLKGCYSRRITKEHRLVYSINDDLITVYIISVVGHYSE